MYVKLLGSKVKSSRTKTNSYMGYLQCKQKIIINKTEDSTCMQESFYH